MGLYSYIINTIKENKTKTLAELIYDYEELGFYKKMDEIEPILYTALKDAVAQGPFGMETGEDVYQVSLDKRFIESLRQNRGQMRKIMDEFGRRINAVYIDTKDSSNDKFYFRPMTDSEIKENCGHKATLKVYREKIDQRKGEDE